MTLAHMIYIPFLIVIGFAAGWHMAASSVRAEWDRAERRRADREQGKTA